MKRFWKVAEASAQPDGAWAVLLDGRTVRTPARAPLTVPGEALARAITAEWEAQGETIDPRSMAMTGFANATLDRVLPHLGEFRGQLAAYAESDLLCYRADGPESFVAMQAEAWDPLLDWARHRLGIEFVVTDGVLPVDQPALTLAALRGEVEKLDPWLLAGAATLTQISGTLVGVLAFFEGAIEADALFHISILDDRWQEEKWGADAEATAYIEGRRMEFIAAARYSVLVRES